MTRKYVIWLQVMESKTLLEFYRLKLKEWRSLHGQLELEIAQARRDIINNSNNNQEAIRIMEDTAQLRDSLSELQLFLYKEKEHVLRLVTENDQLRIDKADDKRRINFLLKQCEMTESQLEGRHKKSPKKKIKPKFHEIRDFNRRLKEFHNTEPELLKLKINALEAQLNEQTELLRDELITMQKDIELRKKEWESERKILINKIYCLDCQLKNCQNRKLDQISDIMNTIRVNRDNEVELIEENERLKRLNQMCKEVLGNDFPINEIKPIKFKQELNMLKVDLKEKDQLIRTYELKFSCLKQKITNLNEMINTEKEQMKKSREKWNSREEYLLKKLEDERKRRLLESEGFRNDVKLLRSKLQSIERQIKLDNVKKKEVLRKEQS